MSEEASGDDYINVTDHHFEYQDGISTPDTAKCGPGDDQVKAEADDTVAADCERVRIMCTKESNPTKPPA